MKPGYKTSEFYVTIAITALVSFFVAHGFVAANQADTLTQSLLLIYGGLAAITPSVVFFIGRTWLKAKTKQATADMIVGQTVLTAPKTTATITAQPAASVTGSTVSVS